MSIRKNSSLTIDSFLGVNAECDLIQKDAQHAYNVVPQLSPYDHEHSQQKLSIYVREVGKEIQNNLHHTGACDVK